MNRADLMLAVLQDGRPHTRQDIQFRKGYFLTNNAASELRKRGLVVNHWREGRVDYYQLGSSGADAPPQGSPAPEMSPFPQSEGADNRGVERVPISAVVEARSSRSVTGPSSDYESGATPNGSVSLPLPSDAVASLGGGDASLPSFQASPPQQLTLEAA